MTSIPILNVAIVLSFVALIAIVTVAALRRLTQVPGRRELFEDGAVLSESGLEFLGFFRRRHKVAYGRIESVEVIPFLKALLPIYGLNVISVCTRLASRVVVVKVKGSGIVRDLVFPRYLLFTPRDARAFAEQLKHRMADEKRAD
jgi:hypothetical protein